MKFNKIEGIGLILLLISFGWQLFQDELISTEEDSIEYQIHQKLDAIWELNSAIYTHSQINNSQTLANINYPALSDSWKYWDSIKKHRSSLYAQKEIIGNISILFFIIGSILIIVAKFKESNA